MKRTDLIAVLIVAILWSAMIITMLLLPSCTAPDGISPGQAPPAPQGSMPDVLTKIVYKTNWLSTLAVVGIALSAAAFVQGQKFALPLFAGCATLLATILTITQYAKWIAFVGFGVALVVFAYVTWLRRKEIKGLDTAFKEVVNGAQNLKQTVLNGVKNDMTDLWSKKKAEINGILAEPQSESTIALVNKVKAELGLKTNINSQTDSTKGTTQ